MNQRNFVPTITAIYKYNARDKDRIGKANIKTPNDGDMCLCIGHAGNGFYNYIAIKEDGNGNWLECGEFGARCFGEEVARLDKRSFYLVQAGEPIKFQESARERA